ncbi:MAG: hypothetical protein V1802_02585, partial [Candidatus Aenigmatarchaeota archaeon]
MQEVFLVASDKKTEAEQLLKADDEISRGSITIRLCSSLGFEEDGYFIVLDVGKEAVKKAESLLEGIAEKYNDKKTVLERIKEQDDSAAEGFGMILG